MDPVVGGSGGSPDRLRAPPRWPIVFRNACGAGVGSFIATLPLRLLGLVPETVVVRLFAIVTLLAAIVYAVRWEIHLEIFHIYGSGGRAHVVVLACEGAVMALFLACGPICWVRPDGVLQFVAAIVLLVAAFSLDLAMSWLVRHRKIRTGTQEADKCGLIAFIRNDILGPADRVRIFEWIDERWDLKAPLGKVSYLGLWLAATLTTVASANAPRVGPPVYHLLSGGDAVAIERAQTNESTGDASGEAASSSDAGDTPGIEGTQSADGGQKCGGALAPGEPAPEPQRETLYNQWLGPQGLGFTFAGCPNPAHRLANGVWYAAGTCGSALRSLAVAAPERPGGLLVWAPARFGLARAHDGSLEDATSSTLVGEGEIYTVTTRAGTWLFMRDHLSDGQGGLAGTPQSCGDIREGAVSYLIVPPALSRLWSARLEATGSWLWPVAESPTPEGGTRFVFRDSDPGASQEIVGHCDSATDCTLRVEGIVSRSAGAGPIDVEAALELGPPVP